MSQEDADRIRRAYEVWNESGPAAVTEEFWAEDAVYREAPGWPDAGVYRGRAAALQRMQSLIDLVGRIEVHLDDLIEVGDGRFVACTRIVGESEEEAPYTRSFAVVHRLRNGLVVEADYYLDASRLSKRSGARSRRCPRRTWRSCARPTRSSTAAT
jgi:ketosteroid isomerase-like protein